MAWEDHPRFCRDFVADTHFEDGICHGFIGLSWKVSQLFCNFRNFRYLCIPQPEGLSFTCKSSDNSTPARMAESVDALVSNTSGAIRAGSIPAPGTENPRRMHSTRVLTFYFPHISQLSYFWTVIIISGIHLKKIDSANYTILPAVKTALKKCISQRLIPSPALIGLSPQ